MTTLSQVLFGRNNFSGKQVAHENKDQARVLGGDEKTKTVESDIVRVPRQELLQTYLNDPIVFNSINKYTQIIMSAGYHFEGSDESVKGAEDFYDTIGSFGGEIDDEALFTETFKHQLIIGSAWQENIYNKAGSMLVDLDMVNPLTMDYARNNSGKVIFDQYGNPSGYSQTLPSGQSVEQKFKVPYEVDVSGKIFLPPSRITHFKLYTLGDGLDGLGLVEPIYNAGNRKMNIEQGYANAARRLGYPIIMAGIGDSLHEPTAQQTTDVLNEINEVDNRSSFAFPYYVKLGLLESKKPEKLSEHLDYFENEQVTGLGIPKAFASGNGEATNRSTLARQEYILKLSLKDIIRRTTRTIQAKQLSVLAKQRKWPDVPRLVWGEVSLEEMDSKSKRIVEYAKAGLLTPSKSLEAYIRNIEDLPGE